MMNKIMKIKKIVDICRSIYLNFKIKNNLIYQFYKVYFFSKTKKLFFVLSFFKYLIN